MIVDFKEASSETKVNLMYSTVIPRPIAWIITESKNEKIVNIAPFSFYSGVSSEPPVLMVSIGHKKDMIPKDTLRNIRETGKATICSVSPLEFSKMKETGLSLEYNRSEAKEFNIEVEKTLEDFPPIIKNTQTAFFVDLYQEINLVGSTTVPLFLEIKQFYYDEKVYNKENNEINLDVIGRIGKTFATLIPLK